MKKLLHCLIICVLCFSMVFAFTACSDNSTDAGSTPTADATGTPDGSGDSADGNSATNEPIATPDSTFTPQPTPQNQTPVPVPDNAVKGTVWQVTELSFKTTKKYVQVKGQQGKVVFDCVFTHKATGTTLTMPGFWDGGEVFKIRFAPTKTGVWEYKTVCATDDSLNGHTGSINAEAYTGNLEIYKRGFIKTNGKYFVYADGTPFFYLGDTHWGMLTEEFDSAGPYAGNLKTDSHFKYIVDKRVSQGYTVYQSEPLGSAFDLVDGLIQRSDVEGFQSADRYFQYIAEKGLVHANAQICFPSHAYPLYGKNQELEELARYWVARYAAYPVMWTLAQEIDNDFYSERGTQSHIKYNDNMWITVAKAIHKYDPYQHPLTGHQEHASYTSIWGESINNTEEPISNKGISIFADEAVSDATGHVWWGAQWGVDFANPQTHFNIGKEYWKSNKVAIMYEGKYCNLWTKDFGARAQGWIAFLNGFFGYGYGAQDMWNYKSDYSTAGNSFDGYEWVTTTDKTMKWSESIELPSGYQAAYMKQFLQKIQWWKLVPDFDTQKAFKSSVNKDYSCATIGSDVYVLYLFNRSTATGKLANMNDSATYTVKWFNPRTNEYQTVSTSIKPSNATYTIPSKPDAQDWVLIATKN